MKCLSRSLRKQFQLGRRRHDKIGEHMERDLKEGNIRKTWETFTFWYRKHAKVYKPTPEDLENTSKDYEDLYRNKDPEIPEYKNIYPSQEFRVRRWDS